MHIVKTSHSYTMLCKGTGLSELDEGILPQQVAHACIALQVINNRLSITLL